MAHPVYIAASILSADFLRLGEQVAAAQAGGADFIHVDVMDGVFVPPISYGLPIVRALRPATTLPLDVHLMTVHPERHVEAFVAAGASLLTVHAEVCPHLHRVVQQIRELGARPSVSINPHTPAGALHEILPFIDMVLVMTVNPGYPGQRFIPETLRKIRQVREMADALGRAELLIEVDGGIIPETVPLVTAHGADVLVAGTAVFAAPGGPAEGIRALRAAVASVDQR